MTKRMRSRDFGLSRPTPPREHERQSARRTALLLAILAACSLGSSLGFDQPILALAAVVFLIAAMLFAKDA
jgi:hypothetical protein